jgi:hypothetical protein
MGSIRRVLLYLGVDPLLSLATLPVAFGVACRSCCSTRPSARLS